MTHTFKRTSAKISMNIDKAGKNVSVKAGRTGQGRSANVQGASEIWGGSVLATAKRPVIIPTPIRSIAKTSQIRDC
jgi:hypothetical protein